MECFKKDYSNVYDVLYKGKNYKKELFTIKRLTKKYLKRSSSLLDLGCGTGAYSHLISKTGLNVTGIDQSNFMIKIAKKKNNKNKKLNFIKSSISSLNLSKNFDIISALFHILSYQTSPKKINSFFNTSRKHLKKNGILVFDFWYKKGVLNLRNPYRYRFVENKKYGVHRITETLYFKKLNQIHDCHKIVMVNKKNKEIKKFSEIHKMKFFELYEIKKYLKKFNFEFLTSLDLSNNRKITNKSWAALVLARKK